MTTSRESLLAALDEAWDEESGFLGKLRSGTFDEALGGAYVEILRSVPAIFPSDSDVVNAELVKLIWFAPQFIEWQIDRATSGDAERARLQRIADKVHESVSEFLGVP
jgi:hypothetical protein